MRLQPNFAAVEAEGEAGVGLRADDPNWIGGARLGNFDPECLNHRRQHQFGEGELRANVRGPIRKGMEAQRAGWERRAENDGSNISGSRRARPCRTEG
jgi:hypothetical protein